MHPVKLTLLVLRCEDIDRAASFYSVFGFEFETEKHGSGPEHLSADVDGVVVELYPKLGKDTSSVRIGFSVDNMAGVLSRVEGKGGRILQTPREGRAVVQDLDGHKIELIAS